MQRYVTRVNRTLLYFWRTLDSVSSRYFSLFLVISRYLSLPELNFPDQKVSARQRLFDLEIPKKKSQPRGLLTPNFHRRLTVSKEEHPQWSGVKQPFGDQDRKFTSSRPKYNMASCQKLKFGASGVTSLLLPRPKGTITNLTGDCRAN